MLQQEDHLARLQAQFVLVLGDKVVQSNPVRSDVYSLAVETSRVRVLISVLSSRLRLQQIQASNLRLSNIALFILTESVGEKCLHILVLGQILARGGGGVAAGVLDHPA